MPNLGFALLLFVAATGEPPYVFQEASYGELTAGWVSARVEQTTTGGEVGNAWARVHFHNAGTLASTVVLTFDGEVDVSRRLTLDAQERRAIIVPLPQGCSSGRVSLRVAGELPATSHFYAGQSTEAQIIVVGSEQELTEAVGYSPISSEDRATLSPVFRASAVEPRQLPLELSAYAGIDAIFLSIPFESLEEGRRQVLEAYAATGGRLALARCSPATWQHLPLLPRRKSTPKQGSPQPYGLGDVLLCGESADLAAFLSEARPAAVTVARVGQRTRNPTMSARLPEATPPVGRFFLIMVAFGIAIGPGSWWVVRRYGPAALLLTLPGAAAITSVSILASALVGNGLGVKAAATGVTWLDGDGRGVSLGAVAFFSGMTPGDLAVPNDASWSLQEGSFAYEPGLVLRRGFIPPRTYVEWALARSGAARERLILREEDGGLTVSNALGAHLDEVVVVKNGKHWVARDVAEGARATLVPTEKTHSVVVGWTIAPRILTRIEAPLEEDEFLAHAGGPGLLPLGELRPDLLASEHLFRGKVSR